VDLHENEPLCWGYYSFFDLRKESIAAPLCSMEKIPTPFFSHLTGKHALHNVPASGII
jgi:hypothetical protein